MLRRLAKAVVTNELVLQRDWNLMVSLMEVENWVCFDEQEMRSEGCSCPIDDPADDKCVLT